MRLGRVFVYVFWCFALLLGGVFGAQYAIEKGIVDLSNIENFVKRTVDKTSNYSDSSNAYLENPRTFTTKLSEHYMLTLVGETRLKAGTFGASRLAWTPGTMAVSPDETQLFVAGHAQKSTIGAFSIGDFALEKKVSDLPIAPNSQPFHPTREGIELRDRENKIGRITGLEVINGKLWMNMAQYYDGSGNQRSTTIIIDNPDHIGGSRSGFHEIEGAVRAAGWMGELPQVFKAFTPHTHYTGYASNLPINSRLSMGPSFYAFTPRYDKKEGGRIFFPTEEVLSYSLKNPLGVYGVSDNTDIHKLWNELSVANIGFFTNSATHYILIGTNRAMESEISYKKRKSDGSKCSGYCSEVKADKVNYFWLYSTKDLITSMRGDIAPYELTPIEFGRLELYRDSHSIRGADFNPTTHTLYILLSGADDTQNRNESQPLLQKYQLTER
ncbi:hypothetical protein DRW07_13005 [Alteromonas sediminis]|uniref:Uncharacterized protein n=1 Tax=Alteromonas sediminis TaxID=2259342 RepID=A0A3N5XYN5_9ALTE|nr:hypothetical protein [Alteromonas sediminis]RPJ65730.1 hypothetical protein DRW07_13005 [Alteromonas sediminis]